MATQKFLALLAVLDEKELSAFGKHLRTAHAREKIALQVFDYFKQFHPKFDSQKAIDLDMAANKIAKTGAATEHYARKNLLDTFHDLYVILKRFLLDKKLGDNSLESEVLWLMVQRERGMKSEFEKGANRLFDLIKSAPKADMVDYFKGMAGYYFSYFGDVDNKAMNEEALKNLDHELDMFYDIFRLKIDCEKLNWGKQGRVVGDGKDSKTAIQKVQPLKLLYSKVQNLLSNGEEAAYNDLANALEKYAGQISRKEIYAFYGYLKNHCGALLRKGDETAWGKAHLLDKFALKHELFTEQNGLISQRQILNIVNAACIAKQFAWVEKFVEAQLGNVKLEVQYETKRLCEAMLLYAQADYPRMNKKLKAIEGFQTRDFHFIVRYKTLKLIGMFECKMEDDAQLREAINFENYLKKSKALGGNVAVAALAFTSLFKDLVTQRHSKEKLTNQMETAKLLYYGTWLKHKLLTYPAMR